MCPLRSYPVWSRPAVALGEIATYNAVCIWDFGQLMGQDGEEEEPQSLVILSTKKSQSFSGLSSFGNNIQNSKLSANHHYGQENNILEVPNIISIKKFLAMVLLVNQLLGFIIPALSSMISLHPGMCFLAPPLGLLFTQMRCISVLFLLAPDRLSNQLCLCSVLTWAWLLQVFKPSDFTILYM